MLKFYVDGGNKFSMALNSLSGCQARAARAMLMWSVRQLAAASGVSESSIRRIEAGFGIPENVTTDLLMRLREYFESRGFHFIFEDEHGPGVQWSRNGRRRKERRTRRNRADGEPDPAGGPF